MTGADIKEMRRAVVRSAFLSSILEAMNECEEMGGPEGGDYVYVMREVQKEAERRAYVAVRAMLAKGAAND